MQRVLHGDLSIQLGQELKNAGYGRVLCVSTKSIFEKTKARSVLDKCQDIEYTLYNNFNANPKYEDIEAGIVTFHSYKPDVVLAIGGGSTIDIAKLIIAFAHRNNQSPIENLNRFSELPKGNFQCPLWAVPTTAGSGSEATHFAVVYYQGKKYSIAAQNLLPQQVFLDPVLTYTVPEKIAKSAAIDALCQALESYWAIDATNESREYAIEAMKMIPDSLRSTMGGKLQGYKDLQYAAFLAGKAINISKTTAGHAFSYYLTQDYNLLHGHSVALMLGYVMKYALEYANADTQKKCTDIAYILNIKAPDLPEFLFGLLADSGLENNLFLVGLGTKEKIQMLCESVNEERLRNNPFPIEMQRFQELLLRK